MNGLVKILLLIPPIITAITVQAQNFIVKKASFSSNLNDEFSPVFYRNGIVFCSNMKDNSLLSFTDTYNRLFRMFYVEGNDTSGWKAPVLFSHELVSGYNDGPATFTADGNTIYFSRNNKTDKSLRNRTDSSNKLGIYRADLVQGTWLSITPFEYNDPMYSFCTPSLSPDGSRLFFSSDMPGGYGGMDIYYCTGNKDKWDRPVNLGPVINTSGNEVFPFSAMYGKLYFSSDGHKGLGNKDLYYTTNVGDTWTTPVHMDSAINSPGDDFGLVIDTAFEEGFFSSRRYSNDDIFSFKTAPVEFGRCDTVKEESFCFTLYDELYHTIDTIPVTYSWDFGDGLIREGIEVKHCFPGPGNYTVRLTITDDLTGDTITRQSVFNIDLEHAQQAYITSSYAGLKDEPFVFDGTKTNLGDFTITDYLWNFGDGFRQGGPVTQRIFSRPGEYIVQLGLIGGKDSLGMARQKCFMKKVRIYNSYREAQVEKREDHIGQRNPDVATLGIRVFFMDDISERQRSRVSSLLALNEDNTIRFDRKGILPDSSCFLEKIAGILRQESGLSLEMEVHEIPENDSTSNTALWADQISFFFRGTDLPVGCRNMGRIASVFRSIRPVTGTDGTLELIFMEKQR